jgi:signal peptidase I
MPRVPAALALIVTLLASLLLTAGCSGRAQAQSAPKRPAGSLPATDQAWHDSWQPYAFGNLEMRPNVWPDQGVWVNPKAYEKASPALGDVVAVQAPDAELQLRRVIGVAGDTIGFVESKPTRNGKPIQVGPSTLCQTERGDKLPCALERLGTQRYAVEYALLRSVEEFAPLKVPVGQLYVLADHRDAGADSRRYGPLPTSAVVGRVEAVAACVALPPTLTRPGHGDRSQLPGSELWLHAPAGLELKYAADGSTLLAGDGVTLGARSVPLGVRGLAQHFRQVASEGGGKASRGQEHDFAGHCGFLIEGSLELPGGQFGSLWALIGDQDRTVLLNATYPLKSAAKWKKKLEAALRDAYWEPAAK